MRHDDGSKKKETPGTLLTPTSRFLTIIHKYLVNNFETGDFIDNYNIQVFISNQVYWFFMLWLN